MEKAYRWIAMAIFVILGLWLFVARPIPIGSPAIAGAINGAIGGVAVALGYILAFPKRR
jgi:hypothetical protein